MKSLDKYITLKHLELNKVLPKRVRAAFKFTKTSKLRLKPLPLLPDSPLNSQWKTHERTYSFKEIM